MLIIKEIRENLRQQNSKRKLYFRFKNGSFFLCILVGGVIGQAAAKTLDQQVDDYVTTEVRSFAQSLGSEHFSIEIKPVNMRTPCTDPVTFEMSNPDKPLGRLAITIECQGEQYWKARTQANVEIYLDVLVVASNIDRDDRLTQDNTVLREMPLAHRRIDYFTSLNSIDGFLAKRKLAVGTVISSKMIEAPLLIKRNQVVSIVARTPLFNANMDGIALENGRLGEIIRVQNSSSGKVISGKVVSEHAVETNF